MTLPCFNRLCNRMQNQHRSVMLILYLCILSLTHQDWLTIVSMVSCYLGHIRTHRDTQQNPTQSSCFSWLFPSALMYSSISLQPILLFLSPRCPWFTIHLVLGPPKSSVQPLSVHVWLFLTREGKKERRRVQRGTVFLCFLSQHKLHQETRLLTPSDCVKL